MTKKSVYMLPGLFSCIVSISLVAMEYKQEPPLNPAQIRASYVPGDRIFFIPVSWNPGTNSWSVLLHKKPQVHQWEAFELLNKKSRNIGTYSYLHSMPQEGRGKDATTAFSVITNKHYKPDDNYRFSSLAFRLVDFGPLTETSFQAVPAFFVFMQVPTFISGSALAPADVRARDENFIWLPLTMIERASSTSNVGYVQGETLPIEISLLNALKIFLPHLNRIGKSFFDLNFPNGYMTPSIISAVSAPKSQ